MICIFVFIKLKVVIRNLRRATLENLDYPGNLLLGNRKDQSIIICLHMSGWDILTN